MTPDQISLLRLIKRSACLLIALLHCDQPTTARQLSEIMTIDYATTRAHLKDLANHGLARRVTGGYLPTDKAAQLIPFKSYPQSYPQDYAQTVDNSTSADEPARKNRDDAEKPRFQNLKARKNRASISDTRNENAIKPRFQKPETRKNRASDPLLLSTIIIKNLKDLNNNSTTQKTRKNRAASPPLENKSAEKPRSKTQPSTPTPSPLSVQTKRSDDEGMSQLWETLSTYGILRNARTQKFEAMPHITPALVKQLADRINKPFPQYAGLLVRALEEASAHPPADPNDHRKYIKGKYADYINH